MGEHDKDGIHFGILLLIDSVLVQTMHDRKVQIFLVVGS